MLNIKKNQNVLFKIKIKQKLIVLHLEFLLNTIEKTKIQIFLFLFFALL